MAQPSAQSDIIKTAHDGGTFKFEDGAGSPASLTARFDMADLSITGLSKVLRDVLKITGRGRTRSVRYGAPKYPQLSFSAQISDLSETEVGAISNWIQRVAPFGSIVSTLAIGEVFTSDFTFTMEGTDLGDSQDQTIKCEDVVFEWDFNEQAEGNKFSVRGEVFGDVYVNGVLFATAPRVA